MLRSAALWCIVNDCNKYLKYKKMSNRIPSGSNKVMLLLLLLVLLLLVLLLLLLLLVLFVVEAINQTKEYQTKNGGLS